MANLSDFLRLGYSRKSRGVAQFGSALDWGSSGRRFKSCRPDHFSFSKHPTKPIKIPNRAVEKGFDRPSDFWFELQTHKTLKLLFLATRVVYISVGKLVVGRAFLCEVY